MLIIQTTVATRTEAETLARGLVELRLAACVQLSPVDSVFRWEGAVQEEAETRLDIKTVPARRADLMSALERLHPYDTPELLLFEAEASAAYGAWAVEETRGEAPT